jgi:hypothetical protein
MLCTCHGWTENAAKVPAIAELIDGAPAQRLDVTAIGFCPWCGNHLVAREDPCGVADLDGKRARPGVIDISEAEWERCIDIQMRVSGKALCAICNQTYDRHPTVSYKGKVIPTFQITCTGHHVKT